MLIKETGVKLKCEIHGIQLLPGRWSDDEKFDIAQYIIDGRHFFCIKCVEEVGI